MTGFLRDMALIPWQAVIFYMTLGAVTVFACIFLCWQFAYEMQQRERDRQRLRLPRQRDYGKPLSEEWMGGRVVERPWPERPKRRT